MPPSARALPIYLQIVDMLRQRIAAGEFQPGDRLPSEAELSAHFKTTRATVARGLRELVFERVITRQIGRGSFVAHPPIEVQFEPLRIQSFEEQIGVNKGTIDYKLIDFSRILATDEVATALKLSPGTEVFRLERLRTLRDISLSLVVRYIPLAVGERFSVGGLNRFSIHHLLSELGMPVAHTDGWISVAAASQHVAKLMAIKRGAPVLMRTYTLLGAKHEPLVYGQSIFREEFHIRYSLLGQAE